MTLAAVAAAAIGQAMLFTADDLSSCTSEGGAPVSSSTPAADLAVGVGAYAAAALAVLAIIVLVHQRRRGRAPSRSGLWIALAVLVFIPATVAFFVGALIAGYGECGFF